MDKAELISIILNKLEALILNIDEELEYIRDNNTKYEIVENLLQTLSNSKVDFALTYNESSTEMKQAIREILLSIYQDEEEVDNIINEIINLCFLHSQVLLFDDDFAEQKKAAIEVLEELEPKLAEFHSGKELISDSAIDSRKQLKRKLVEFGSIFGNGYQSEIIDNIEMLDEITRVLELTDDEAIYLLASIIETNNEFMKEMIIEHEDEIQEEIERSKEEVEEEIEDENDEIKEIDIEVLEEINRLLSKKDVVEKIVRLVCGLGDSRIISINNPSAEEAEIIMSSIEIAREYLIDKVLYEDLTPEEALEALYQEHKQSTESILKELNGILVDATEDIPYQEQIAIINKGTEFYNKNKKLLQLMSKQDKERVNGYMTSTLYKEKENRINLYRNMSFDDNKKIVAEATFEIKVILDLLDSLDSECLEYKDIIKKVSKRIADILECVATIEKETGKEPVEETEEKGKLFYLMRNDKKSMFEDDVRLEDLNKGISPEYYDDLMEALNAIRNRSETTTQFSLPAQEGDNYLKKNGVQVTSTSRVKVLYIPVGKKDAIIVGVVFSYGKQFQLRDHDDRVRRYQAELNRLKTNIESGNATRDMEISSETDKRIEKALKNDTKKSSLRAMFETIEDTSKKESNGNGKK